MKASVLYRYPTFFAVNWDYFGMPGRLALGPLWALQAYGCKMPGGFRLSMVGILLILTILDQKLSFDRQRERMSWMRAIYGASLLERRHSAPAAGQQADGTGGYAAQHGGGQPPLFSDSPAARRPPAATLWRPGSTVRRRPAPTPRWQPNIRRAAAALWRRPSYQHHAAATIWRRRPTVWQIAACSPRRRAAAAMWRAADHTNGCRPGTRQQR